MKGAGDSSSPSLLEGLREQGHILCCMEERGKSLSAFTCRYSGAWQQADPQSSGGGDAGPSTHDGAAPSFLPRFTPSRNLGATWGQGRGEALHLICYLLEDLIHSSIIETGGKTPLPAYLCHSAPRG